MLGSRHAPSSNAPDFRRLGRFPHLPILRIILASRCKCLRLILYPTQWIGYEALAPHKLLKIRSRSIQEAKFQRNYSILQIPIIATGGSSLRCTQMQADGSFANRFPLDRQEIYGCFDSLSTTFLRIRNPYAKHTACLRELDYNMEFCHASCLPTVLPNYHLVVTMGPCASWQPAGNYICDCLRGPRWGIGSDTPGDAACDYSFIIRQLSYVRVGHERLQYAVESRTTGATPR